MIFVPSDDIIYMIIVEQRAQEYWVNIYKHSSFQMTKLSKKFHDGVFACIINMTYSLKMLNK